jgi:hypothetical protein
MNVNDLPRGESKKALEFPHFPTRLQAVVWRNWGLVPVEKLAEVLKASPGQIEKIALDMGLSKDDSLCPLWHERGYLTIIRRNWHLLPYEQLLELLDWTPDEMAFVLKEDDFLWHKLGNLKPETSAVFYAPLTEKEEKQTVALKKIISKYFGHKQLLRDFSERHQLGGIHFNVIQASRLFLFFLKTQASRLYHILLDNHAGKLPAFPKSNSLSHTVHDRPFGFLKRYGNNAKRTSIAETNRSSGLRLTYSYSAVYGDPLLNENLDPYPDGLLADYAAAGINAVWLQGTLYTLVPWFGDSKYSTAWKTRLANLRKLCVRAEKFGIKVYLYINEPRAMPADFFDSRPDWKGMPSRDGLSFTVCTSRKEVLDALSNGISELFRNVPELGGILTITMSENLTNCCSRLQDITVPCPACSVRGAAQVVAEINQAIAEGAHRIKPEADVIAWTWAWSPDWDETAVELLPKDVKLMCVSETDVPTDAMGVKGRVLDYSISKVGPGPISTRLWKKAKDCGLDVIAKIQVNNTWECSAVPYIPVPGLVEKHLRNLEAAGVKDFMLNWTLGGYPGGNMELLKMPKEKLALKKFGEMATPSILKAWDCFDRAFEEFPLHSTSQLYTAPQNFGPMSLLADKPTGYKATMIGFPYDDLESWRGNHYPEDIFEEQFRKLSTGWADGLKQLSEAEKMIPSENKLAFEDLANVAEAAYCHFRSTYLQIRFVRLRNVASRQSLVAGSSSSVFRRPLSAVCHLSSVALKEINAVLDEEIELAQRLHAVMLRDSRIGFEASNHYYYTTNDLKEKILNCERIREGV